MNTSVGGTDAAGASLSVAPGDVLAPVHPRVFGSFVEHMGRTVYTGIFEPGHPSADADGFRTDVLELVRELGVTVVRYPGGNFVSGYRWEDGVGPVEQRPVRLNLAWHATETNEFGLGEFVRWAERAGLEPMMALNLGTRGVAEALDLLEYCNHPGGTTLSDLRVAHGSPEPYGIRMWCLGNEMDGPWQLGHKTAAEYARLAAETARGMRQFDPSLELVACGSSGPTMPTFGEWEDTVLAEAYDLVDHISAHAYYEIDGEDLPRFLASSLELSDFLDEVVARADRVGERLGNPKRIAVSLDEWNVWYLRRHMARVAAEPPTTWPTAPRLSEDAYTVADAVVLGSLLIAILRRADRVTAACLAQLVNSLGAIRSEPGGPAWRQSIFHPFALTSALARDSVVLRGAIDSPLVPGGDRGEVPAVDAVATWRAGDDGQGPARLTVFAVNRHLSDALPLTLELGAFPALALHRASVLHDEDWRAANTAEDPQRVAPRSLDGAVVEGGRLTVSLPPLSWSVVELHGEEAGSAR